MQLKTLNEGLRAFDAVEIVPMYQASIVCVGVSWGWTFYQENKELDRFAEIMFAVGCSVSVLGISLLSFKKPRDALGAAAAGAAVLSPTAVVSDASTALLGGLKAGAAGARAAAAPFVPAGSIYSLLEEESFARGGSRGASFYESVLQYPALS